MNRLRPLTQYGFSIVEIMIVLVLGLVLLGGTLQIFITTKKSYNLQDGVASVQESGRYAIHALRENILMAGFPRIQDIDPFDPVTSIDGISDQVTVRYQADTDCLGAQVLPAGTIVINRLFVDVNTRTLRCDGNGGVNAPPQTLVEGIEAMQVLYGVDTDSDNSANRYINAGEIVDWNTIVSIRIALLARSRENSGVIENRNYFLLDALAINRNDALAHRIFTTTIPLRNRLP